MQDILTLALVAAFLYEAFLLRQAREMIATLRKVGKETPPRAE